MGDYEKIPHKHNQVKKSHFERIQDTLGKNEKVEYLTEANMGGLAVLAATSKKVTLRPAPSVFKSGDKRAIADIPYKDIDAVRKTGIKSNKVEIEAKSVKYDGISGVNGLAEYIANEARLTRIKICPDCKEANKYTNKSCTKCNKELASKKGKSKAERGARVAGGVVGVAGAVGGIAISIILILVGLLVFFAGFLLTITLILAIIGIPVMIFGAFLMAAAFGVGALSSKVGIGAGRMVTKGEQLEWRRLGRRS